MKMNTSDIFYQIYVISNNETMLKSKTTSYRDNTLHITSRLLNSVTIINNRPHI